MALPQHCPQGSQDPVFNIQRCDIPCVFPVPQGGWGNFWVPRTPQAIVDFDDPGIIDLDPDFPCPSITVDGGSEKKYPIEMCEAEEAFFFVAITKDECCSYDINFELQVPCPEMQAQALQTSLVFVGQEEEIDAK